MDKLLKLIESKAREVDASFRGQEHISVAEIDGRVDSAAAWLMGSAISQIREDLADAIRSRVRVKPKEPKKDTKE